MNEYAKTAFTSMVLNAIDGRNPSIFIEQLDGEDCVEAHNVLRRVDRVLKRRWELMGSPAGEGFIDREHNTR